MNDERLMNSLKNCEILIDTIRKGIIERAGKEKRVYLEEEEYRIARLDSAVRFVKQAQFEVSKLGFEYSHVTNSSNNKPRR